MHEQHSVRCANTRCDRLIGRRISLNDLSRPIIKNDGAFDNPFPTWSQKSLLDVIKFVTFETSNAGVPKDAAELDRELPILRPDFGAQPEPGDFRVTWIGHSTLLIQVDGLNILTDPLFSNSASPIQFMGPKRYRPPACTISALPSIDIVLVSHNHYDHLDSASVRELNDRFGMACRWIVPLGLAEFMESMKVVNFVELDWWQKDCYHVGSVPLAQYTPPCVHSSQPTLANQTAPAPLPSASASPATAPLATPNIGPRRHRARTNLPRSLLVNHTAGDHQSANGSAPPATGTVSRAMRSKQIELDIYFTPSQHWSRRGIFDTNKSLWGSFTIISSSGASFFFAGDTGYCSVFKEISRVFGPFSGAAIPIGAYKPQWFLQPSHVDPNEAVQIHRDLRSAKSVAIHHSTFVLSYEHYKEPARLLNERMAQLKRDEQLEEPFVTVKHGESIEFRKRTPSPKAAAVNANADEG